MLRGHFASTDLALMDISSDEYAGVSAALAKTRTALDRIDFEMQRGLLSEVLHHLARNSPVQWFTPPRTYRAFMQSSVDSIVHGLESH